MPIYKGSTELSDVKIGGTSASAIYVGAEQIWPSGSAYDAYVLSLAPWAYWKMDAIVGSSIIDSSVNGRDQALSTNQPNNPTDGAAAVCNANSAINFPADSNIFSLGYTGANPGNGQWQTINAWCNTADAIDDKQQFLASWGLRSTQFQSRVGITIGQGFADKKPTAHVQGASTSRTALSPTNYPSDTIMVTGKIFYGTGSNQLQVFVNGVLAHSSSSTTSGTANFPVSVGGIAWNSSTTANQNYGFKGRMSNVSWHQGALSDAQILELYNLGKL